MREDHGQPCFGQPAHERSNGHLKKIGEHLNILVRDQGSVSDSGRGCVELAWPSVLVSENNSGMSSSTSLLNLPYRLNNNLV